MGLPCRVTACRNPPASCPAHGSSCSSSIQPLCPVPYTPALKNPPAIDLPASDAQAPVELFSRRGHTQKNLSHALDPREGGLLCDGACPDLLAEHYCDHRHYYRQSTAGGFAETSEGEQGRSPVGRSGQGAKQQPRSPQLSSSLTTVKWREKR